VNVRGVVIEEQQVRGNGFHVGKVILGIREIDTHNSTLESRLLEKRLLLQTPKLAPVEKSSNIKLQTVHFDTPKEFASLVRERFDEGKFGVWLIVARVEETYEPKIYWFPFL